jgi:putative transcriptional regulator
MTNKLKVFRAINNWTQEDLAQKINVSRQTIVSIEKNKYIPSTVLALKLAIEFNCTVENLFELEAKD